MKNAKYGVPAVQSYAFGGIANPTQMATLRSSDKEYLDARQKELDEFEKQRIAYNDSLAKWQTEVYNPYKSQVEAYNTGAQKYNTDVYEPYKKQFDDYVKAVETWNAGPRTSDYAGPAEPKLAKAFDLTAPVTPEDFKMAAPVVPFKEEEVVARQKEAAARATQDAGNRAVAIDVVSDPDRFNFGSMSVSNRFMAEGGEVKSMADEVAQAGRGGDELLAYLSPEALRLLKENGGSGTINPETGLPEFFNDTLKSILAELPKLEAAAAATATADKAAAEKAAADAKELADFRAKEAAVSARWNEAVPSKPAATTAAVDLDTAIRQLKAGDNAAANLTMRQIVGLDPMPGTAIPNTPVAKPVPTFGQTPAIKTAPVATFTPAVPSKPPPPPARDPVADDAGFGIPKPPSGSFVPGVGQYGAPSSSDGKWFYSSGKWYPNEKISVPDVKPPAVVTPPPAAVTPPPAVVTPPPAVVAPPPVAPPSIPYTPPAVPVAGGLPGMTPPGSSPGGNIPISTPTMPTYSSRGVGAVGTADSVANKNYFAMTPETSTGLAPGSAAIGPADMPLAGARGTLNAMGLNKNLSPTMLGGAQNAGYTTDRLGNRIYGFAKGGGVDVNALLAQNTETLSDEVPDDVINTDPVGTAQKMLADLGNVGKVSPTRQSIKRVRTAPGGGATADKSMQMPYEGLGKGDLGAMKDVTPAAKNTDSARAQMEELARVYQLKIRAAQNKAKGLSADTFGAPTLEGPTLTKGKLTKKRFKDGGEAKKPGAEGAKEPGIFSVNSYATDTSERMFPDQMGQDDERDAARHMLAAATLSRKFGPRTAEFLGKAYERTSSPESFFSMFGIGKPREDYEMDVHNNKVGVGLGSRATSQEELEKLVQAMAMQSQNKQVEGKPWTMSDEQQRNRKPRVMTPRPEYRAEGSPVEGELSQEEIDAASRPAFVTPKSGKGRKQGEISKQLKSGDAYINMAKGVTELPYDLAGAPVDLATMAMRPFGYGTEKPVMGSDFIKEKMTQLGVRPEPPADPTAKGFYTAGELLSNLVNPAGATRAGVKAAEKTGKAATEVAKDFQQYNRQLSVPGASYAVRPTGSTMLTGSRGLDNNVITVSAMDQLLANGMSNAGNVAGQNAGQAKLIAEFWDKKARNYFERQFGTPDDPVMEGIKTGQIKGETLSSDLQLGFPKHLIDSLSQGKMRYKEGARPEGFVGPGAPEGRFFPKYPEAVEDFTRRYDTATGLRGNFFTRDPVAADPNYDLLSQKGRDMAKDVADIEADKLIAQGVRPELINTGVGTVTRSVKDPKQIIGDGTSSAKKLYDAFEQAVAPGKTNEPGKTGLLNKIFGENKPAGATSETQVAADILPENVATALQKNEPVYDIAYMDKRLRSLFNPASVNEYLATLPPRELANIRFEDAIRGGLKLTERTAALDNVAERIRAGKPVADAVFSNGVSAPLLQIKQGPLEGFAWKRIEKREATVPEGAYVGHSVGGYEVGGAGYTKEKREGFNTGRYQVYTLRDNRNRPVNTVEVQMLDENTPVVMQIKGNGRATGNVPAASYDNAVLDFFENYLRPAKIDERDEYLTPLLKKYKEGINAGFKMP